MKKKKNIIGAILILMLVFWLIPGKAEQVQAATTYKYGNWSSWSNWSLTPVTSSDVCEVRTTTLYRYYYFYCPVCGGREPLQGKSDCGKYSLSLSDGRVGWFTTPYSACTSHTYSYAGWKRYTFSLDGARWNFSNGNLWDTAIGTKDTDSAAVVIAKGYSYRTRSKTPVTVTPTPSQKKKLSSSVKISDYTAAKASSNSVKLTWNRLSTSKYYITGYRIYQATSSNGTYRIVGTVSSGASSYTVKNLKAGYNYYFKIRAYYSSSRRYYSAFTSTKKITLPKTINTKGVVCLKEKSIYTKYDFTGDGRIDKFQYIYTPYNGTRGAKVYINGRYIQTIDLWRGGSLYRCEVDQKNTFLIATAAAHGENACFAYVYKNGRFVSASGNFSNYGLDDRSPYKVKDNYLYIGSSAGKHYWVFSDYDGPYCFLKFKVENQSINLASQYVSVSSAYRTYRAMKSMPTSSSSLIDDSRGVYIRKGDKVIVEQIYFGSNGRTRMKAVVNGRTGWFDGGMYQYLGALKRIK